MKTRWISSRAIRLALPALMAAGWMAYTPARLLGADSPRAGADRSVCCPAPSPTQAKKVKAPKKTKAVSKQPAAPQAEIITGSHLKQRTVLRRFPETVAPVEIWDRQVIERRGEATLGGFLSRQATFR